MLHRDIAASMLKILCQKVNPVKSYSETKLNVFVFCIKSMGKIQVGLNFFWPVYFPWNNVYLNMSLESIMHLSMFSSRVRVVGIPWGLKQQKIICPGNLTEHFDTGTGP